MTHFVDEAAHAKEMAKRRRAMKKRALTSIDGLVRVTGELSDLAKGMRRVAASKGDVASVTPMKKKCVELSKMLDGTRRLAG